MKGKNLSQCFDLLASAFVCLVLAMGCAAKHEDSGDRRARDFGAISTPSAQPDRRLENQNRKPGALPKPVKHKAR